MVIGCLSNGRLANVISVGVGINALLWFQLSDSRKEIVLWGFYLFTATTALKGVCLRKIIKAITKVTPSATASAATKR